MNIQALASAICMLLTSGAWAAPDFSFQPSCPVEGQQVVLTSVQHPGSGPTFSVALSTELQDARVLKIVYLATPMFYPEGPPQRTDVALPKLAAGDYVITTFYRIDHGGGMLTPEVFAGMTELRVRATEESPCAWRVVAPQGATLSAAIGSPLPGGLSVRVLDANGAPVKGAQVRYQRLRLEGDLLAATYPTADAVLGSSTAITDEAGFTSAKAVAGSTAGSYQYVAIVSHANESRRAYFTLRNVAITETRSALPVIEYRNVSTGHYFMTANADEMAMLDAGVFTGWQRTGVTFAAFGDSSGRSPVCRFYGRPEAGLDSHFYSASPAECQDVVARFPHAWSLETTQAFWADLPDLQTGGCSIGVPLHRVYNNRPDSNHRYLPSLVAARAMVTSFGYVAEGYGPDAVAMCVLP